MRELNTQEMNHVAGGTLGCVSSLLASLCKPVVAHCKPVACAPVVHAPVISCIPRPAPKAECAPAREYSKPAYAGNACGAPKSMGYGHRAAAGKGC